MIFTCIWSNFLQIRQNRNKNDPLLLKSKFLLAWDFFWQDTWGTLENVAHYLFKNITQSVWKHLRLFGQEFAISGHAEFKVRAIHLNMSLSLPDILPGKKWPRHLNMSPRHFNMSPRHLTRKNVPRCLPDILTCLSDILPEERSKMSASHLNISQTS